MGKKKVLVKVHLKDKFVVDVDKNTSISDVTPSSLVVLRNDSYTLHKILPNKVDSLVSLMMVKKVPDSAYEMIGRLDRQIKEIKEVIDLPAKHPELFKALGIAQPKGMLLLAWALAHHRDCVPLFMSLALNWYRNSLGNFCDGRENAHLWRGMLEGTVKCSRQCFEDGFEATKSITVYHGC
uniref:Proteasomal ATPase second OB domain-containing protein n=1 Tax=Gorilla gorilla gorilla TaxID=9595 RepID=A0A2I2ZG53_GORGO